jgi:hypothetical protein
MEIKDSHIIESNRKELIGTLKHHLDFLDSIVSSFGLAYDLSEKDMVRGIKVLESDEYIRITYLRDKTNDAINELEQKM